MPLSLSPTHAHARAPVCIHACMHACMHIFHAMSFLGVAWPALLFRKLAFGAGEEVVGGAQTRHARAHDGHLALLWYMCLCLCIVKQKKDVDVRMSDGASV